MCQPFDMKQIDYYGTADLPLVVFMQMASRLNWGCPAGVSAACRQAGSF